MYSQDGTKYFVVGIVGSVFKLNESLPYCAPGSPLLAVSVFGHLDWIKSIIGSEMCLTNSRFRSDRGEFGHYLQVVVLCILSSCLTACLIAIELKRSKNSAAPEKDRRRLG